MNIYSEVASHLLEQLSDIEDSNEFHNYGRSHLECVFDFLKLLPDNVIDSMYEVYSGGSFASLKKLNNDAEEIRAAWAESVTNQESKYGFRMGYCNYEQFCRGLITGNFLVDKESVQDERAALHDRDAEIPVGQTE